MIGQLVPGGSEKMTLQVATACSGTHEIVALGPVDAAFVAAVAEGPVRVHRLGLEGRGALAGARALRAVARLARSRGVDVLQGHAWRSSVAAGAIGRLLGIPALATLHRVYYPGVERMTDRVLQHLWSRVVVDSGAVRRLLVDEAGLQPARIEVIPNFVSPEYLDAALPVARPAGELRVLMAAHFTPVKGHRYLLEALRLLRDQGGGVTADLLGEGPLLEEVREQARRLGVGGDVRFHGPRSDLARWIGACDAVVLPSLWEGFGLILAEAMAAARPAVAFDIGGAAEVIVDSRTGFLTPAADSAALASALRRLRDDPALRARLGAAGREHARARYSPEVVCAAYERLYAGVARTRRRR